MIDAPTPTREQWLAQLLQWLPGMYRARGEQPGDALRGFLALFADELWRMRRTVEQAYADHFIDSAQGWAIPYLAELVGTEILYTGDAAQQRDIARLNRDDVKNTVRWRRRKGTLAGLQDMAQGVGGWGVHAQEMFERVAWMQDLAHLRKQARFALDLRDGAAVARAATPFSDSRAWADLRTPGQRTGWHQTRNVCVFEWPIASHPLRGITPRAIGGGRYTFHPLGLDTALHASCDSEAQRAGAMRAPGAAGADIGHPQSRDLPIRTADLRAHPGAYVGSVLGFSLYEDGIALVGGPDAAAPLLEPCLDYADLAGARGLLAADTGVFPAGSQFELAAARLGAVLVAVKGVPTPVAYSPGLAFAAQLQLVNPHGRLALDTVTPDFSYTRGIAAYQPHEGEFHHPVLLLRLTNTGAAAAALPESELVVRNGRGSALQVALPALAALAPAAELYFYVATDGSTYYARGDHTAGVPDRNPDRYMYGAYSAVHLARASAGQRRLRPGRPAGAARFRSVVARDLCCWDRPLVPALAPGQVAIDPQRGRIAFAAGEVPAGELSADFRFGLTAAIGAGPYARPDPPPATAMVAGTPLTVARTRNAGYTSVQDALDAAPDGAALPVVIELLDSAVYEEALVIAHRSFPGGLRIQAAALQTPLLLKPAAAPRLLDVFDSTLPLLALDGLLLAGGAVRLAGGVAALHLRACSLQPASVTLDISVAAAIDVQLRQCIAGPIAITAPQGLVTLRDCIVQHPAASIEAPAVATALSFPNGVAALEACTLLGSLDVRSARISNTLCYGDVRLADREASCLRYSRLPPSLAAAGAFACTQATPIFVSIAFGDAGYAHLHPNTAAPLLGGGAEGGEIGAFAGAGLPWRTQNTGLRLNEYVPAGIAPVQIRVLPRQRFRGNLRS